MCHIQASLFATIILSLLRSNEKQPDAPAVELENQYNIDYNLKSNGSVKFNKDGRPFSFCLF